MLFFTKLFQILYQVVSWLFPEFKFKWLVDESKKHLPIELDFEHEGRNAEKIMHFFKKFPFLKVGPFVRFGCIVGHSS